MPPETPTVPEEARSLHKVTMNLTPIDVSNTEKLRNRLHARSNAQVVSTAISITTAIADIVQEGGTLMVRDKNGELQRVVIPGFV
jgi:hypothetical protein